MMKRALIIAAHPDDETLGCGGLISKYLRRGVAFKVVVLGEGSSCRYSDPQCAQAGAAIAEREKFATQAMALLGVDDVTFQHLPCGRFDQVPIIDMNKAIEAAIADFQPDTLFTHSPCDANNDHKIAFDATVMATRPGAKHGVARLLTYEVLSSSEWGFVAPFSPNYFEELSEVDLEVKWQALARYESEVQQFPYPRSREGVRALAMTRGMQAGFHYAEAFHLVRELKK